MCINENVNITAQATIKDNEKDITVAYFSATMDTSNMNITMIVNTVNKELIAANNDAVKGQFDEFFKAMRTRGKQLGYSIFSDGVVK